MQLTDQPKCLRITLKLIKILLHLFRQHILYPPVKKHQLRQTFPEPLPDRSLSKMSEWRIPDIMYQSGALQDIAHFLCHPPVKARLLPRSDQILSDILSE